MNIDTALRRLGDASAEKLRQVHLMEDAWDHLKNLDLVLQAVLEQGEIESIEAAAGMRKSVCLELMERYAGLRFRHNGELLTVCDTEVKP